MLEGLPPDSSTGSDEERNIGAAHGDQLVIGKQACPMYCQYAIEPVVKWMPGQRAATVTCFLLPGIRCARIFRDRSLMLS